MLKVNVDAAAGLGIFTAAGLGVLTAIAGDTALKGVPMLLPAPLFLLLLQLTGLLRQPNSESKRRRWFHFSTATTTKLAIGARK